MEKLRYFRIGNVTEEQQPTNDLMPYFISFTKSRIEL